MIQSNNVYRISVKAKEQRSLKLEYLILLTALAGIILTYINWRILQISKDIKQLSQDLLDVNVVILEISKEVLQHTKTLQEKI